MAYRRNIFTFGIQGQGQGQRQRQNNRNPIIAVEVAQFNCRGLDDVAEAFWVRKIENCFPEFTLDKENKHGSMEVDLRQFYSKEAIPQYKQRSSGSESEDEDEDKDGGFK